MNLLYKICRPCDVESKYDKQLRRCSMRNLGYMWYEFMNNRKCKKSKVVICFDKDKIVGWGYRFKYKKNPVDNHSIMLFVYKSYRNRGIGTQIYRKLTRGIKQIKLEVYPDSSNKKFFRSVKII